MPFPVSAKGQPPTQIPATADGSVQVKTQRENVVRACEAAAAVEKNIDSITDQQVEEAVAYLKQSQNAVNWKTVMTMGQFKGC